jgi:hypothetical protein
MYTWYILVLVLVRGDAGCGGCAGREDDTCCSSFEVWCCPDRLLTSARYPSVYFCVCVGGWVWVYQCEYLRRVN